MPPVFLVRALNRLRSVILGGITPLMLSGAVPTLDHLYPPSLTPGGSNTLTAVGTFDPWPVQLLFNHPGIIASAETNKGSYSLRIDPTVPIGSYLARAIGTEGASEPRLFLVTREPAVAEVEPNDAPDQAQEIAQLPACVEGRLVKRDDVDQFVVRLAAGQTLVARVEAFVLGSPLDAALRLRNASGTVVAWNHDDGYTLDPFLHFTAADAGAYRIEVFGFPHPADSEIRFAGNPKCVYRLHLHHGPWIQSLDPAGLGRPPRETVIHTGWNLPASPGPLPLTEAILPGETRWVEGSFPGYHGPLRIPVGIGEELRESDGSDHHGTPPFAVTGALEKAGETDRHPFNPSPGTTYRIEVQAAPIGSPLDAWLRLEDADGKELAMNDDASMGDPALTWKATSTNRVTAVVGSHLSARGPEYRYRMEVRPLEPRFRAIASSHALVVQRGATNEFKVNLQRIAGFDRAIQLRWSDLPEGVVAESALTATNATESVVRFFAPTNAPTASVPLRLGAVADPDGVAQTVLHEMATTGENNGVPQGHHHLLIPHTDWLWITVK